MKMYSHGSSSSSSITTTPSSGEDYEVFLSFHGPDTRRGFTDHLYHSLRDAGVHVFRDNEELRVGGEISSNLTDAINNSKISIPIFSKGYASSKWCLNELVHIAENRKAGNQIVMPIFYNITPFDVRNQTGGFEEAFQLHDYSFSEEIVGKWKQTLKEVGSLKGWDFTTGRQHEGEVTKEVVNRVLRQLKKSYVVVTDFLVGVEDRVENIKSIILAGLKEEKIIGIHGPGGIGKTTLVKVVYNQLSNDYEGCSFLANVRDTSNLKDTGIMRLQNQLISDILKSGVSTVNSVDEGITTIKERLCKKKVLICFDDVSKRNQLNSLVGNSSNWFGPGSKIIITTRNKELLNEVGAYSSYEVTEMDFNQSLQLFSKHAFRRDCPPMDYIAYSEKVVELTGGLPLALEVIGSLLHGKPKDSWGVKLEKLEKVPHEEVRESLMISYEELDYCQKQIFLDVTCFFVGLDKTTVLYFWDSDLYPQEGMDVLEHMSLLKIKKDNTIWMHDQLIDFGRNITYEKGNVKQDNRRRWCENDEAFSILKKGQKGVEAMCFVREYILDCGLSGELFTSVPSLTFLQVHSSIDSPTQKLRSVWQKWTNPTVLPQLRWLSLHYLDPQLLRINLQASKLIILDLSDTRVTHKWDGWSQIKAATSLKVLNLTRCKNLKRTPDFSALVKLERLILHNCSRLVQIHKSVGRLKRLLFLDLSNCCRLLELPEEVGQLESLIDLVLTSSGVESLPGSVGNIKSLKVLSLLDTVITELPAGIERAENLAEIYAVSLRKIPSEIGRLSSLVTLKILGLSAINQVPKLPESLIHLHLEFQMSKLKNELPDLSNLVNLRELVLRLYDHREVPSLWWIGRLSKLETLTLTAHNIPHLSTEDNLGSLSLLKTLHLFHWCKLQSLPRLPSGLLHISISNCKEMRGPIDVSNLNRLFKFNVSICNAITEIHGLPSSLGELDLWGCRSLKSIGDISNLKMLSTLIVYECAVTEIQGLDCLENLKILRLSNLPVFERLSKDMSGLSKLKELELCYLPRFQGLIPRLPSSLESLRCEFANTSTAREILGLEHMENLQFPTLAPISGLESLPPLPSNLKKLILIGCEQLLGLPRLPQNLEKLDILLCSITTLDVLDLTELKDLRIRKCPIEEIRGLHSLVNLSFVWFNDHTYTKPNPAYLQRELTLHYGIISSEVCFEQWLNIRED